MSENDSSGIPENRDAVAWRDFGRNIRSGIKLALFMRVAPEDIKTSWFQVVALIALGLAAAFAADFVNVGLKGEFFAYGLPGVLFYVPLTLVAAYGVARLARRPEQTLTFAIALLALAIPLDVISALYRTAFMHGLPRWMRGASYMAYYLPQAWLILAATVASGRLLALRLPRRGAAFVVVLLVLALPQALTWKGSIWTPRRDSDDASSSRFMAIASEDAYYEQAKLLDRELSALKPGRKGIIDLYFVGMAGYASQDVFMKEVNSVSKLFQERFDAEGHTVRLINNAKTLAEAPIASVTALRATLTRIAQVMDRDEDILFLFLTSHGSQEHRFSLEFWPMSFKPLDPKTLRTLLDESGIKRRVVVVSACYSGGFVDPLKDENSLVIAASAANRNSFGCNNDADFTYFGKAYFDEALRETYSFTEAFEKAKPKIAAREKQEDFDGSDPQISIGANIKPALAELEDRLSRGSTQAARTAAAKQQVRALGKYAQFVSMWVRPDLMEIYRKECLRVMGTMSPSYYVKKDSNYFGGLNEKSRHWPRFMVAWAAYSEEYCQANSNERLFRESYIRSWSRSLEERDLDASMKFLKTEAGRHFVKAANEAAVDVTRQVSEMSRPLTDGATQRYQEEQVRINADF